MALLRSLQNNPDVLFPTVPACMKKNVPPIFPGDQSLTAIYSGIAFIMHPMEGLRPDHSLREQCNGPISRFLRCHRH